MIKWLSTGKSQAYQQALQALDKRMAALSDLLKATDEVRKRVVRLEIEIRDLQELHNALDSRHQKLSGAFFGKRGGRPRADAAIDPEGSLDAIPPGDKDALRARIGLRAGVRYTHEEK